MKALYYLIMVCSFWIMVQSLSAQDDQQRTTRRQRQTNEQQDSGLPTLSVRAESKNEDQTQEIDNVIWLKEIYRYIDLTKEENTPLYYPVMPIGNRMNLFTLIFKLMSENKIKGYEYNENQEDFSDRRRVKFKNLLESFKIYHQVVRNGNDTTYVVDNSDIPSNEVTLYMIKEAWYFNQANGIFDKKILAICPMLIREEDDLGGQITRNPLFWIPYETIRPYISQSLIMTSNMNNALTYTTDDFFRKGMYKGEIFKTTNLMNRPLMQIYGTDSIKAAQDSIENQLRFFEKQLWVPEDTTQVTTKKGKDKKEKSDSSSSARGSTSSDSSKKEETKKEEKPQKAKAEKSSSGPTKSVRRTR